MAELKFNNIKIMRSGQSLIELIVAITIAVILIGGVVTGIAIMLRLGGQNKNLQTASLLGQEILNNASAVAEADWHDIDTLASPPATFYINTSATPFIVVQDPPSETILVNNISYVRYFTIEPVSRDSSGAVEAIYNAVNDDPSTKKITSYVSWSGASPMSIARYVTRGRNAVSLQSDWSGGEGQAGVFGDPSRFDISNNVDFAGGSIRIQGF